MLVLLADSGRLPREGVRVWAADGGHEVTRCMDVAGVWRTCQDAAPALLILDWDLSGGGLELCRRIQARVGEESPFVLLLAPENRDEALREALGAGADEVLLPPFREHELDLRLSLAERRITEVARWREEHRSFVDLLAEAPDLIQTVAPDGRLLHVNRAWRHALGYDDREIEELSFFDLVRPEGRARVRKAFRLVLRGRTIRRLQTELRARDGQLMIVEGSFTPRISAEQPTSVRVILRDVSRRMHAETVLRNVLEGTSATTGKGFFRSLVRHLARALGVRHALVARRVPGSETLLRTLAVWNGDSFRSTREFELPGGIPPPLLQGSTESESVGAASFFPGARFLAELEAEAYLGVPLTNAAGESIGLLCVLDDRQINTGPDALRILSTFAQRAGAELERLRVQERLANSEARMRAMLDAMPDLLFRMDAAGRYLFVHAQDESLLYAEADTLVGHTVGELLPADFARVWMAHVHQALDTGEVDELEYELPVRAGLRQFEARLVRCGPGEVLAIVRDVTARVRSERERRELDRRMQESQKLESMGVLAGGIAHDFNNLLTSIMGYASLAQRSALPGTSGHRYLADIEKASRRAADLAMQMLAYSGKGQFVVQPLDLCQVIRETTGFLNTDVMARGVVVRCELPEGVRAVEGDVTQMRQVIMNLLLNAAQAMEPSGGTVVIDVCEREVDEAELAACYVGSALPPGPSVVVSIADAGCGMDAETLARIFDPFFTTKPGGRGLGLAAVVGIVRGHYGALRVESEAGVGTRVQVYFPPSERPALQEEVRRQPVPARGEGLILVVDDEPALLQLTTDILESGGYRVITAADGAQGVEVFRDRHAEIDAVLLDMTMPVMGGVEAYDAMRAIRSDLRVVVSSGYTEQEAVNRFPGDTPTDFIQKPYTAPALLQKIGAATAREAYRG